MLYGGLDVQWPSSKGAEQGPPMKLHIYWLPSPLEQNMTSVNMSGIFY